MSDLPRHQCLIYEGSPAAQLPALATAIRDKLAANYRCLYLHTEPMVLAMRCFLEGKGVDVDRELDSGRLILSSDRGFLVDGRFETAILIQQLEDAVKTAIADGYTGFFASGDVAWEFGGQCNFEKLADYERQLEELFQAQPCLSGICQYHADHLTPEAINIGASLHPVIFFDDALSRPNPIFGLSLPV